MYYGDIDENYIYTPEKTTGKTIYKYDIYEYTNNRYDNNNPGTAFFEIPKYYGNTLTYEPKSYRYNNLIEKTDYRCYNGIYTLVNKETNNWWYNYNSIKDYQYTSPYPLSYCPSNAKIYEFFMDKWTNYGTALLESHAATSYTPDGNNITRTENYTYKANNLLASKYVSNSNTQSVGEEYSYPGINLNGSTPAVIQQMVDKNIIAPTVNQIKKVYTYSAPEKVISGYKIDYKEFTPENTTIIMPEKLYELEDTTYMLSTEILSYTKHGNPQEAITRDNMHTVYLWGYNYRYLIAEIKNATLDQVSSAVQSEFGMSIEALAQNANPNATQLNNLRNNANLSNTHTTTFTYGLWGKVTSITDPSNKTIYYNRDGFGRLIETYYYEDNNPSRKRVIETYKYHFKD